MPQYGAGIKTPPPLFSGYPLLEIIAGATCLPSISSISITVPISGTGSADAIGLGRPAAAGLNPKPRSVAKAANFPTADEDAGSSFSIATQWQTPPTAPTNFLRRMSTAGTVAGANLSLTWRFPFGLSIVPNATLVLWQITAATSVGVVDNAGSDVSIEFSE